MWSNGTGSEIMQRIAVPMIGGMISSTLLTLVVIPAVFGLVKGFQLPRAEMENAGARAFLSEPGTGSRQENASK
jgi:copper/silver efflux system protein